MINDIYYFVLVLKYFSRGINILTYVITFYSRNNVYDKI